MLSVQNAYRGKVQAVVFDWAGTTVDYGCFAPLAVFIEVFEKRGIPITIDEAREPMGMLKKDHIRTLCEMERIKKLWMEQFGKAPNESDVEALYADFEPLLLDILPHYASPIPGVIDTVEKLRKKNIKIGSTTGYTQKMANIVAVHAKQQGYCPDTLVSSSEVPAGRPFPWMCYQNAMVLGVYPMAAMIKVGDTVKDVQEGINAGMWSVAVIKGSSEFGMSLEQVQNTDEETMEKKAGIAYERFKKAEAHYIIDSILDLNKVMDDINYRMARGESPSQNLYQQFRKSQDKTFSSDKIILI